ncbi:MAG: hypothetical protein S0880_22220 [Actinomycetota bacterium]|nr:hypothetical protein [Actinomycetota bacterium]
MSAGGRVRAPVDDDDQVLPARVPGGEERPGRPGGVVGVVVLAIATMCVGGAIVLGGSEPTPAIVAGGDDDEPSLTVTELVRPDPGAATATSAVPSPAEAPVDEARPGEPPAGAVDDPRPGPAEGPSDERPAAPAPEPPGTGTGTPTTTTLPMFEPAEAGPDDAVYAVVGSGRPVIVRAAPDTSSDAVAVLPDAATSLPGEATEDGWLELRGDGGGWVDASDLVVQHGTAPPGVHARALEVAAALHAGDRAALASVVHAGRGVLISTDAFVEGTDVVLGADDIAADNGKELTWGRQDGTGEPIVRTIGEQLDVLGALGAVAGPDAVGFDTAVGTGNTEDNLAAWFGGATVVELHDEGTEAYGGFDWTSLRMAFVPDATGTWWLVALTQDNWTI